MKQGTKPFGTPLHALLVVALLMAGLLMLTWAMAQPSQASTPVETQEQRTMELLNAASSTLQVTQPMTVYLPMVGRSLPRVQVLGTEMWWIGPSHGSQLAVDAGIYWVRFDAFHWDEIEPQPGTYLWNSVDEGSLKRAADNGFEVIATIKFTPAWAQKVPGFSCGPIKPDALDDYARFLEAVVKRYNAPPYNVRYWELGNEPDVDPTLLLRPDEIYGCWGDKHDRYYGGGYYAEMLKVAYPAIKAADPGAQVLIGGLLLDCDPTHPPQGKTCAPAHFFEGILRNGGADYFDIVSFHSYPIFLGTLNASENFSTWDARGGIVLGKIDFLREVMSRYGVDKPILNTEGSLLCSPYTPEYCDPPVPAFYEAQADYVVWLYVRNWAAGLIGTIWYPWEGPGWRYSGMLDEGNVPKASYNALKFLSQELDGAIYKGLVSRYPALKGYEFAAAGKRVWVLWAADEQPHTIDLPPGLQKVYDKYGQDITPAASNTLLVNSPVYVELAP